MTSILQCLSSMQCSVTIIFFILIKIGIAQEKFPGAFDKDQDILVIPLDLTKFDTHEKCMKNVLSHFHKVICCICFNRIIYILTTFCSGYRHR